MKHKTTKRFRDLYSKLAPQTKELADKAFSLLKENHSHSSLQFKKVGTLYSVRINISHRALAIKDKEVYIWVWLGNHDEYEKMIK